MTRSRIQTTLFLLATVGGGAACLVPSPPRECRAGEPPAAPADAPLDRVYDLSGIRSSVASIEGVAGPESVQPFGPTSGWKEGLPGPEAQEPGPSLDRLIDLARSTLPPDLAESASMDVVGGDATIRVRTTAAGHDRVASLLDAFRADWGTPYEIDLRVLTLGEDAAGDALLAETERAPRGRVGAELAARLVAADARHGLRGSTVLALPGRWAFVEAVRETRVAADFDVEIAEAASIADPVAFRVAEGVRAAVRACPISDGRALVSFAAAAGDVANLRRLEMRTKDLGALELPDACGALAVTETSLAAGETTAVVLAAPTTASGASSRYVVVLRLASVPSRSRSGDLAILPTGALCAPRPRPAFGRAEGDDEDGQSVLGGGVYLRWLEPGVGHWLDGLVQQVHEGAGGAFEEEGTFLTGAGDWPGGGALILRAPPATLAKAAAVLAEAEREATGTVWTSVRLVETPPDVAKGEDAVRGGRTVGVLAGPVVPGGIAAFASHRSTAFVGDYDVEVAQSARIADPIPLTATGGVLVEVRLARAARGAWRVDASLRASSTGPVEPAPAQASEVGVLERIPVRRTRFAGSVVVAPGTPRAVDLGESPWRAPGTTRLWAVFRVE
jgi:hypothetical protein